MSMRWIEVDDRVFKYLQNHAQPFIDSPNGVLLRLLFGENEPDAKNISPPISMAGLPKALSQILEVLYEIQRHGYTRSKATRIVAEKNNTVPPTIMDKYCKQLDLKARDVDLLLEDPGYEKFKQILKDRFDIYNDVIDMFFETLFIDEN